MSISSETKYFHDFVHVISNIKVLRLSSASGMFLVCSSILGIFQPHVLMKKVLKKECNLGNLYSATRQTVVFKKFLRSLWLRQPIWTHTKIIIIGFGRTLGM